MKKVIIIGAGGKLGTEITSVIQGSNFQIETNHYGGKPDAIIICTSVLTDNHIENILKYGVPVVSMTTDDARNILKNKLEEHRIPYIIDVNHALPIIDFFDKLEQLPSHIVSRIDVSVTESHQQGKKDPSGSLNRICMTLQSKGNNLIWNLEKAKDSYDCNESNGYGSCTWIRHPRTQMKCYGISEKFLSGHAFHHIRIDGPIQDVDNLYIFFSSLNDYSMPNIFSIHVVKKNKGLEIEFCVFGRAIYGNGAVLAMNHLLNGGDSGDMVTVLKNL
jgi:dihydrodipicolinate reductase